MGYLVKFLSVVTQASPWDFEHPEKNPPHDKQTMGVLSGIGNGPVSETMQVQYHPSCVFTVNGQPAKVTDLRQGDHLEIDGSPAVKINVLRRK